MPYLYFDMGAAVLCASFMSFGVKRRWFALGAALQLAISTYAAYIGGYVHYGDWLKVSASALSGTSLGCWGANARDSWAMPGAIQEHSAKPGKAEPPGVYYRRYYRRREWKDLRHHANLPFRVWTLRSRDAKQTFPKLHHS